MTQQSPVNKITKVVQRAHLCSMASGGFFSIVTKHRLPQRKANVSNIAKGSGQWREGGEWILCWYPFSTSVPFSNLTGVPCCQPPIPDPQFVGQSCAWALPSRCAIWWCMNGLSTKLQNMEVAWNRGICYWPTLLIDFLAFCPPFHSYLHK